MADISFPSVIIVTEERALVHYNLFAISKVLPTVPKIRLSCILCPPVCVHRTGRWFPLRRSEDTPVEHPGRENPVQLGRGGTLFDGLLPILFLIEACGSRIL